MALRSSRCHLSEQGDRRTPDFPWFEFWKSTLFRIYVPGLCVGKTTRCARRIRTHAVFALRVLPATRRHPSFARLLRTTGVSRGDSPGKRFFPDGRCAWRGFGPSKLLPDTKFRLPSWPGREHRLSM